ncbi:serine/threonine-protein kinase [Nannocystis exedens]|uniref:serine/threonine-protein kinase n=1 Tax=Nannocystis exedens TaxID=54 RepID=UPI001474F4F7|nr:serine/threonine-protein kinase [Nannocystis exedens]
MPARPRLVDPFGKQLLKRSLLPSRAGPVQIGRFTVVRKIGQGGMGTVYACYDEQLDRKVAVKVLHTDARHDRATAAPRLLREAQAMARMSHPNIVTVLEVGASEGSVYVAMEFIKGESLERWLERPRTWRETVATYVQAGLGLAAAHRAGIVHRDFKPQNVMIGDDGAIKVLDFGLARATDEAAAEPSPAEPPRIGAVDLLQPLTRTGVRLGTPAYMSPEQYRGETATTASDQFSFCVALYRGLYGAFPFPMTSLADLQAAVLRGTVAPPPAAAAVPQRLLRVLLRGLKDDPTQRFGSMEELVAALEHEPLKKYRLAAAVTVTAAVAGSAGLALAGGAAIEQCPDARAELASIWGPEAAAELRAAATARSPAQAEEALPRIVPKLDAYANEWVDMRNEACRAHAEGRHSAQLFDLRTACLDQRRASLAATVEVVQGAGQVGLDAMFKAVAALPSLATCADSEALTAAIPPPGDPELRAQVQQHRETLARVEVLEQTGQLRLGLQLVDEVLADPQAAAYAPLIAEANYLKGSLQQSDGAPLKALEAYERALWSALELGHAPVAARASQRRGVVLAYHLLQPLRARESLELMAALNRRVRHDVALYAEYLDNAANVRFRLDDSEEAARLWQEAIALREEHGLLETAPGIGGLYNFAMILELQGRCAEALPLFHRVLALSEKTLGASEPHRPLYEMAVALCLVDLGRPHAARERMQQLERSLERFETDRARKYGFLGRAYAELAAGDGATARQYVTRALEAVPEEVLPEFWSYLMMAAALENDAPAVEQARAQTIAALAGNDPRQGATQIVYRNVGKALASLGRHEEAIEVFVAAREALADATSLIDRLRRHSISLELGKSRTALGDFHAAEQDLEAALAGFQADLSPRNRELADAMLALGELALARQRLGEATTWLGKAEAIYAATAEQDYPPRVRTRAAQARAAAGSRE